ncbi:MAG: hypothetical protein II342_03800, partial [Clostridia bacterium]|nr:hypothetical protein [Clostridia bacterium]
MVNVSIIESYKKYGKCVCISNGVIEAYVTVDLGPRIIRFGFVGEQNIMNDHREKFSPLTDEKYEALFGKGKAWESMGGHRVWVTTESYPETYTPDDRPVAYEVKDDGVVFTSVEDVEVGIAKTLTLKMDPETADMTVQMNVKNISGQKREYAIWALSVCDAGGYLILPMNTNNTGLLHNRSISVWPYTDLSDKRIRFGKTYTTIKQDVNATTPVKLGFDLNKGLAYYVLGDDIFRKRYDAKHDELPYP